MHSITTQRLIRPFRITKAIMDLKGLQWLGNVYNKFEAMCVEMEEAMYQDTVKYVENQVQTVNQNVKRFCAEVVKDFHQDSDIDLVTVAAADLSLNPYVHDMKQIASAKKELTETCEKSVDDSRVLISGQCKSGVYKRLTARKKGHSSTDPSTIVYEPGAMLSGNLSSAPSSVPAISWSRGSDEVVSSKVHVPTCRAIQVPTEAKEKIPNPTMDTEGQGGLCHVDSPIGDTNLSHEPVGPKENNLRPTSAVACSSSIMSCGEEDTWVINKVVSSTSQNDVADADTNSGKSVEEVLISQQERLVDCTEDAAKKSVLTDPDLELIQQYDDSLLAERLEDCSADAANNSYLTVHDMELIEPYDDSSLAETCVLVEKENLLILTQSDSIRKSYKKKIKEAFSGKKRSTRKEYEQLGLKYKDQNLRKDVKPKISLADTCSEPDEWELL